MFLIFLNQRAAEAIPCARARDEVYIQQQQYMEAPSYGSEQQQCGHKMNGDPGPSTEGVEMQDRRAAAVAMRSMTVYPSAGPSKEAESHAPLAPPADFALRGAALSAGDNLLQPRPEAEPTLRLSHPDPSSPEPQLDPGSPRIASQEGWAGAVAALHDELAASRNEIQNSRR